MSIKTVKFIDIRKVFKTEDRHFTVWLENNINALEDVLPFKGLEVSQREMSVGPFSVDLVCQDFNGELIAIENQFGKTDHDHLGKLLTYAINLEGQNIIWISEHIRQEHMNVLTWINEKTPLNVFGIEIRTIKIGDSEFAPYFQLIVQPDAKMKSLGKQKAELNETRQFNFDFWKSFIENQATKVPEVKGRTPGKDHFLGVKTGFGGLTFTFLVSKKYYGVELYIDLNDEQKNRLVLDYLTGKKKEIEASYPGSLSWQPLIDSRACRIRDVMEETNAHEIEVSVLQDRLIERYNELKKVLSPHLRDAKNHANKNFKAA